MEQGSCLCELAQRHVLGVLAPFLLLGTTGYAASAGVTGTAAKKLYACVTRNGHPLKLSSATLKCAAGQHKISWNLKARPALRGRPERPERPARLGCPARPGCPGCRVPQEPRAKPEPRGCPGGPVPPQTVYGRGTGTTPIAGEALIKTTVANSSLSVINPTGEATALTVSSHAGGVDSSAASLVIERLG